MSNDGGARSVRIERVSKRYRSARGDDVQALDPVDLEVAAGEFVSIVGPSGCGKSTLLNILSGFEEPTTGTVLVGDDVVRGPAPDRGVVFQDYALFPWLTVAGNIGFGPASRGLSSAETNREVERCLSLVRLDGFAQRYPHELSGGMRQRCALARCIANDPDLMLMDEPLAALDALTRLSLQEELLQIWSEASRQRPKTVIYITHAIEEAVYLSDRVIVMSPRPGRVRRDIRMPFGRPRPATIRTSPDFHRISDEIWTLLRDGG